MKVMYICSYTGLTGATQVMLSNIDSLMPEVEFLVILPEHGPLEEELKTRGVKVHCMKYFNWIIPSKRKVKIFEKLKWIIKIIVNFFSSLMLMEIILKEKVSIIQINTLYTDFGFRAGKVLRKKIVWYAQEVPEGTSDMSFWNRDKTLRTLKHADGIICVSNFVRQYILSCGVLPQRIQVVYNATSVRKGVVNEGQLHDPIRISLIAGVANCQKNQLLALKAVNRLLNDDFSIILSFFGIDENSDDKQYFEKMKRYIDINELSSYVRFYGFVKNKEFIYGQTDITLSCALDEAFGLTIVESMVRKIPVVAVNSGGTRELLNTGENGGVYKVNDELGLTNQLKKMINDSDFRSKVVNSAYEFGVKKCDPKNTAAKILKFYKVIS